MNDQLGPTGTGFIDEEMLRSRELKTIDYNGYTCLKTIDRRAMDKATFLTVALKKRCLHYSNSSRGECSSQLITNES